MDYVDDAADNEDGPDFWKWIVDHYYSNLVHAGSLLDTYLFSDVQTRLLVATISLIDDDRVVGKAFSIPGIWIGGANVRGSMRQQGIASAAFAQVDTLIQAVADATKEKEFSVNLFSDVEHSERLAIRHGYEFQRSLHIEHFDKEARWWRKNFCSLGVDRAG